MILDINKRIDKNNSQKEKDVRQEVGLFNENEIKEQNGISKIKAKLMQYSYR